MNVTLSNNLLSVEISTLGAELQSIINVRTGRQYLWQGDPRFWNRRSPILFPTVGSVWEGRYRIDGVEYEMGQHGFARDYEFEIIPDTPDDEAWFALESDAETLKMFPRRFRLEIGYRLQGERLTVLWKVKNLDDKEMPFHIGAHPAFYYPDFNPSDPVHGYFLFDGKNLRTELLKEKGCMGYDEMEVVTDDQGMLPITATTFDIDTIVLANRQVNRVSFLDKHRAPYISVLFNAPVVGMWSPGPDAPFLCIEPWYGRCDRAGYEGEFRDREYTNLLPPSGTFDASYLIIFEAL